MQVHRRKIAELIADVPSFPCHNNRTRAISNASSHFLGLGPLQALAYQPHTLAETHG